MVPNKNLFDFKYKVVKKKSTSSKFSRLNEKKEMGIRTNYLVVILQQMREDEMNLSNIIGIKSGS